MASPEIGTAIGIEINEAMCDLFTRWRRNVHGQGDRDPCVDMLSTVLQHRTEMIHGDALTCGRARGALADADVIFINNYLFGNMKEDKGSLNGKLEALLSGQLRLKHGCCVITTAPLTGRRGMPNCKCACAPMANCNYVIHDHSLRTHNAR
jgi:hypothetical protein